MYSTVLVAFLITCLGSDIYPPMCSCFTHNSTIPQHTEIQIHCAPGHGTRSCTHPGTVEISAATAIYACLYGLRVRTRTGPGTAGVAWLPRRHAGVARREAADAAAGAGRAQRRGVLGAPLELRLPAVGEGQERPEPAAAAGSGDGGAVAGGPAPGQRGLLGGDVAGVLADEHAGVDGQRGDARRAADEKQRREALHLQPVRVLLQVGGGGRRPRRQPLVVDPLEVAVLRQRQDRR
jgi:hypothetical protein